MSDFPASRPQPTVTHLSLFICRSPIPHSCPPSSQPQPQLPRASPNLRPTDSQTQEQDTICLVPIGDNLGTKNSTWTTWYTNEWQHDTPEIMILLLMFPWWRSYFFAEDITCLNYGKWLRRSSRPKDDKQKQKDIISTFVGDRTFYTFLICGSIRD